MPRSAFPMRLGAHELLRLTGPRVRAYPRLRMLNAPTRNQDACKGAKLKLAVPGTDARGAMRRALLIVVALLAFPAPAHAYWRTLGGSGTGTGIDHARCRRGRRRPSARPGARSP